jgi:hypothetical protein
MTMLGGEHEWVGKGQCESCKLVIEDLLKNDNCEQIT